MTWTRTKTHHSINILRYVVMRGFFCLVREKDSWHSVHDVESSIHVEITDISIAQGKFMYDVDYSLYQPGYPAECGHEWTNSDGLWWLNPVALHVSAWVPRWSVMAQSYDSECFSLDAQMNVDMTTTAVMAQMDVDQQWWLMIVQFCCFKCISLDAQTWMHQQWWPMMA